MSAQKSSLVKTQRPLISDISKPRKENYHVWLTGDSVAAANLACLFVFFISLPLPRSRVLRDMGL
jgi:hypothetical protein